MLWKIKELCIFAPPNAKVAELVDALDSKSSDSNIVRVRFPPLVLSLSNKTFLMVPWMSGLVSGLQNRVRRFESARNLTKKRNAKCVSLFLYPLRVLSILFYPQRKYFNHPLQIWFLRIIIKKYDGNRSCNLLCISWLWIWPIPNFTPEKIFSADTEPLTDKNLTKISLIFDLEKYNLL